MTPSEINDYLARQRPLYLTIARRISRLDNADDLAQEAMLEVAKVLQREPGKPDAYYTKAAKFSIFNKIRERENWTGSSRGNRGGQPVDPLRHGTSSMDETFGEGDDLNLHGVLGVEEAAYAVAEANVAIRDAIQLLDAREQQIAVRIANDMTKQEIADELGITRSAVNFAWNKKIKPMLRTHLSGVNEEMKAA